MSVTTITAACDASKHDLLRVEADLSMALATVRLFPNPSGLRGIYHRSRGGAPLDWDGSRADLPARRFGVVG